MSIHPTAIIDSQAQIDPSVVIGPHVVIEGPVTIGPNCRLGAGVVIYGPTTIGSGCRIHAHAVLGDVPQDRAFTGEESFVHIGNDCVIREGVTIHRGSHHNTETRVGDRCMLMTNSHIGHNCVLENDVVMISGSLLGGYVHVGPSAVISGNAAVHQFVRIGELAMISGLGKIVQDIPPFFMTDREGGLVGVNRVGLLRRSFTSHEREEIKAAYRIIYRSGLGQLQAFKQLVDMVKTDAGNRLIAFLSAKSRRGIAASSYSMTHKDKSGMETSAAVARDANEH
ncbi:acyl-ACP--UDP-N-acetylglucosamine O-acyltransferase [Planctomicrobium piriforme]|uniref:UDP-N-acetylglucosamine acyltransferase n=1 Tax=Planctomicrobium piriforme TaxID=1576369 RepID=A0A1I3D347_9PLAN|nr:acyl-ACP--UDP-N-acetylglucosamine O-acyltransferase [Planctomicrobium piriforme]SFH81204.1 UDP-N-acetylglucosamine acyltransferase [Planctomicrobium piriforme]